MRTIRRISRPLNKGKWNHLVELARHYTAEKQVHLTHFTDAPFAASGAKKERARRDELVQANYRNGYGLQARQWKMAEKDAYETVDRQWAALAVEIRPLVMQHTWWSEAAHHYAFWLLKDERRLAELVSGKAPSPAQFSVPAAEQKTVRNYLRRVIRRKRGAHPAAKTARSFALDADMYTVFEQAGAQFISVMSLTPRQRIVVPLTGTTPILGNVRLVLDFERQRVEVHYTAEVKTPMPLKGEPCGLDAGISEVFTDEQGTRYVPEFGEVIRRASDGIYDKGRMFLIN